MPLPTLDTPRLRLRPFTLDDAPALARICADRDVAKTTLTLPHPYQLSDATTWIPKHTANFEAGAAMTLAITMRDLGILVGNVGLTIHPDHHSAEMGYLIGKAYWGRGYCTEAAHAVLAYAFSALKLNRIYASHFATNPASGRVMQKIGMTYEGRRRQHYFRFGQFVDAVQYGILKDDPRS
jgi:[ribosomal protein S5]-alanine N-acetyltransferase